ncbi:MAG: flagellar hook-length control protein FliK [Acidiphilium sp.]
MSATKTTEKTAGDHAASAATPPTTPAIPLAVPVAAVAPAEPSATPATGTASPGAATSPKPNLAALANAARPLPSADAATAAAPTVSTIPAATGGVSASARASAPAYVPAAHGRPDTALHVGLASMRVDAGGAGTAPPGKSSVAANPTQSPSERAAAPPLDIAAKPSAANVPSPALPLAFPAAIHQTSAPAAAGETTVPSPSSATAQLAAAMVGVGPIPAGEAGGGKGTRVTIAMAPPAIGMVTMQIDRNADGTAVVAVGATHPATLDQLQNDRSALEQMLTQAGVPADHRTISFRLDTPSPASGNGIGSAQSGFSGGYGFGGQQRDAQAGHLPTAADYSGGLAYARPDIAAPLSAAPAILLRRFGVNVIA